MALIQIIQLLNINSRQIFLLQQKFKIVLIYLKLEELIQKWHSLFTWTSDVFTVSVTHLFFLLMSHFNITAIAWSPHHHGLLASGGGTADRCIRFWNTLTGQPMQSVDTGSQVCNLAWSKHASELVSYFSKVFFYWPLIGIFFPFLKQTFEADI